MTELVTFLSFFNLLLTSMNFSLFHPGFRFPVPKHHPVRAHLPTLFSTLPLSGSVLPRLHLQSRCDIIPVLRVIIPDYNIPPVVVLQVGPDTIHKTDSLPPVR